VDNEDVLLQNIANGIIPIQEIATDLEQTLYSIDPTALPDSSVISTDPSMIKCDNAYRSILLLKYKHDIETQVLKKIKTDLFAGQIEPSKVLENFERNYKRKLKEFERQDNVLQMDDSYKEFRTIIWNIRHPNEPFSFGDGNEDDEIRLVGESEDYRCPITVSLIELACFDDRSLQGTMWTLFFICSFRISPYWAS
jgi:hypothetical protein